MHNPSHERFARPLIARLPLFPLEGAILLPRAQLPLNIFEPRYLAMVDDALASHRMIGMIQPVDLGHASTQPILYGIGGVGRITSYAETEDGRYLITLTGLSRFVLKEELLADTPYRQAEVSYDEFGGDLGMDEVLEQSIDREQLLDALHRYFLANNIETDWESIQHAPSEALINSLSMIAPVEPAEKQALLEARSTLERSEILIALIELSLADGATEGDEKPNSS